MKIEFDPAKNESNIAKHGVSFADFDGFDAEPVVIEDTRFDYGEVRYQAFGRINGRGHCLVFTMRAGRYRLISFRPAHEEEIQSYE